MIKTQYGSEVVIVPGPRLGDGWIKVKRISDGAVREWHVSQLRADTPDELKALTDALYGDVTA